MRRIIPYFIIAIFFISCTKDLKKEASYEEGAIVFNNLTLSSVTPSNGEDVPEVETPVVDVNSFKVQIENLKGQLLKEWSRFDEIPNPIRFGVGQYVMRAHSGDSTAQGFDLPSYSGTTSFSVAYKEVTPIDVVCRNNKTLISVKPAQGFIDYYPDFKTNVSAGSDALIYVKDEKRIGYFVPGDIDAKIYITRADGKKLEATMPTVTNVKPNDHYTIRINTGSGAGSVQFSVIVEATNEVVSEVIIPLSAVNGKAPYFITTGFSGEFPIINVSEGTAQDVKLLIKAGATIEECICDVKSAFLIGAKVPGSFNFANLNQVNFDAVTALKGLNLKWSESMQGTTISEIDFSKFVENLPAQDKKPYEHMMTITVRDYINRKTSPLPIKFIVHPPVMEITNITEVKKTDNDTKADITFTVQVANGTFDLLKKVMYKKGTTYTDAVYTITKKGDNFAEIMITGIILDAQTSFPIKLVYETKFARRESAEEVAYVSAPKFVLQTPTDANTSSVKVAVVATNLENIGTGFDESLLKLYNRNQGEWERVTTTSDYDQATGVKTFTITGMAPSEQYRLKAMYNGQYNSYNDMIATTKGVSFEEEWPLDFTATNMNSGGAYGGGIFGSKKQDKVTVDFYDAPSGHYKTTNSVTADKNANPKNSWFVISSVIKIDGSVGDGVLLRSVAYSSGGIGISDNVGGTFASATSKSSVPIPNFKDANYAVGQLITTLNLKSKPYSVTGYYKFTPYGGAKATVSVIAYAANGQKVGEGRMLITDHAEAWVDFDIVISYSKSDKVAKVEVVCSSGETRPTSAQLNFDKGTCQAKGNELYIDELNLKY